MRKKFPMKNESKRDREEKIIIFLFCMKTKPKGRRRRKVGATQGNKVGGYILQCYH